MEAVDENGRYLFASKKPFMIVGGEVGQSFVWWLVARLWRQLFEVADFDPLYNDLSLDVGLGFDLVASDFIAAEFVTLDDVARNGAMLRRTAPLGLRSRPATVREAADI